MSEFSNKLSKYISASGYNVYQLAKEASLDRTTLQRTVKGQRIPSLAFIKDICSYIKISERQEEELLRLFQIEKYGKNIVEVWNEITQTLKEIHRVRKKILEKSYLDIHIDKKSITSINQNLVQEYNSETDIVKAIMCIIEQEILEEKSPEVYMDVSWATPYVLSQLTQSILSEDQPLVCHQMVNLRSVDDSNGNAGGDFQILEQILPYAFVLNEKYDIRYAYVSSTVDENQYFLWPHYIVTHKHVFICSENKFHAILITNKDITQYYHAELEKMIHSYRPMVIYHQNIDEELEAYHNFVEEYTDGVIYEECPSVSLLVSDDMQQQMVNKNLGNSNMSGTQIINIFGMYGMRDFVKTGHLPGIYYNKFEIESLEERRAMLENFHLHLLAQTRQFHMINEEKFIESNGLGIKLFGKNKIVFYSTDVKFPLGAIVIDEPGICELFYSYFLHLLEEDYVYSVEDTIARFEQLVEEYFQDAGTMQ